MYVIDPLYREVYAWKDDEQNGITSLDLCIFDLITTPRHFASGSILLLTQLPEEMEEQKIWVGEGAGSLL